MIGLIFNALGGAGLVTKLGIAAGLVVALLAGYGVWHHKVYANGYRAALADIARADNRAVGRATQYRQAFKNCRADGKAWDVTTGACR